MKKKVLDLRPTQTSLGLKEVENKVAKMKRMGAKRLAKYMKVKVVPIVLGPNKEIYLIDHHHHVRACWELGIKSVHVKVVADLSQISMHRFWEEMKNKKWVYELDQFGNRICGLYLPDNIKGLADDPMRSLAWMVREKGGFKKVDSPFSEFHWADFFRSYLRNYPRVVGYPASIKEAMKLCKCGGAESLPGFIG